MTYPYETADAIEHFVACRLAGELEEKGVLAKREVVILALDDMEIHPLLVAQCLERVLNAMSA